MTCPRCNERTGTLFNDLQVPTDIALNAVLWRHPRISVDAPGFVHYTSSLGDLLDGLDEAPVRPPRGQRADFEAELESGRRVRIVTVGEADGRNSYDELLGEGYFCYVPV